MILHPAKQEEWRMTADGFYQVSNLGRVRRMDTGRIRVLQTQARGYSFVMLSVHGKFLGKLVHRLVAAAFLPPCPPGKNVNHKNGIKTDNRVENLEWLTPKENTAHARSLGNWNHPEGERCWSAKLTANQIKTIRVRRNRGEKTTRLGREYGVSSGTISAIATHRTWRHIK